MAAHNIFSERLEISREEPRRHEAQSDPALPLSITKAASKQTYYTIRFLADHDRVLDAFRAYAYFRWLDDRLDQQLTNQSERISFLQRQQRLVNDPGLWPRDLTREEQMLADLIAGDHDPNSGLQAYIRHMMAVMAFDADRRGQLISQDELAEYSHHLATAVTEAMHYFIGHDQYSPRGEARYRAVTGAHITHMLRDTCEDVASGYFNAPREMLESSGIDPSDLDSAAYRAWVKSRVELARSCFAAGRVYLAQVESLRCRLAGYAYMARFEGVLDAIEREGYHLRAEYPERKRLNAVLRMGWSVLVRTLTTAPPSRMDFAS